MEISTTRKHERQRVVAILDSALAMSFLVICSFTLIFLYAINEEDVSVAFLSILTIPLVLNGLQLLVGIILLSITRKSTRHLNKCKQWVSISKYLTAFTFMEMLVLFQFQFKTLAFGIFGIQYLIRLVAIQKVRHFMERLVLRNLSSSRLISTTIVPNHELIYIHGSNNSSRTTTIPILGGEITVSNRNCANNHNNNNHNIIPTSRIHTHTCSAVPNSALIFDGTSGELHLQFQNQNHSRINREPFSQQYHDEDSNTSSTTTTTIGFDDTPPPTYSEAVEKQTTIVTYSDSPPTYNEAIKARARMHWNVIAMHRNNHGKCVFPQSFI